MKTKTQILFAAIVLISLFLGTGFAANRSEQVLPVEESYQKLSCSNVGKVYLNQDNDNDGLADYFLYLNSNFILNGSANNYSAGQILRTSPNNTKVVFYSPLSNMIYKITENNTTGSLDDTTFRRASWVFPYNTPVRGIATTPNKVVFEQPSNNNPNYNTVGFVYAYKYKYATSFDNGISNYRYNQVPNIYYFLNTGVNLITVLPGPEGNKKRNRSNVQSLDSCKNYELHRCGDGKIDTYNSTRSNTFTGEICDDGPNNGMPGYCNATCSGTGGEERCGDNIIQPAGTFYNGDSNNISFEECDDGDLTGDNGDGLLNGDDIEANFCSSICLPLFAEEFTEEFVNE